MAVQLLPLMKPESGVWLCGEHEGPLLSWQGECCWDYEMLKSLWHQTRVSISGQTGASRQMSYFFMRRAH